MVVIADKAGGLGNRLLVFAHVAASAIEHGYKVSDPSLDEFTAFFPAFHGDIFTRVPARNGSRSTPGWLRSLVYWVTFIAAGLVGRSAGLRNRLIRVLPGERFELSSPDFVSLANARGLVFVQGWLLRDRASLVKHASDLRRVFTPTETITDRARSSVERSRHGGDLLIGVHVRQTDYRVHLGGRFFFDLARYRAEMTRATELFPDRKVTFLVCSDEAIEPSAFAGLEVTVGTGHFIEDLYSLAGCDRLLGPPSSYTLWASFYGEVPLYMIREDGGKMSIDAFAVAPDIHDPVIEALY